MNGLTKVILILAIGTLFILISSIVFTSKLIGQKLDELEVRSAVIDLQRIDGAIASEKSNLLDKISDWASWDDTYQFVKDNNTAYIKSNLQQTTFDSLRLSFMIFLDVNGNTVHEVKAPVGINKYLVKDEFLLKFDSLKSNKSGMIMLPDGMYLVASKQILNSASEGPARGTLIFGRYFGKQEIDKIAISTKHDEIRLLSMGSQKMNDTEITNTNENILSAKNVVKDIFGKNIAYYVVDIERGIHLQGIQSTQYTIGFLIGISIIFFVMVLFFLASLVLSPLKKISSDANNITQSKNFMLRVKHESKDEIGLLSRNINEMLDSLQLAKDAVYSETEKIKTFFDVVSGIVVVINKDGVVVSVNQKGAEFLEYETNEIVGRNWFDVFIPEEDKEKMKQTFVDMVTNISADKNKYFENLVVTKSGKKYLMGWHNSLLLDRNRNILASVSHGEDITDKRKIEDDEKSQKEELEKLNQLMMGREIKMIELKKEIEKLKQKDENTQ